ncbi:MAG: rRNA maturation RNase YbeY [Pseudomonadota bacterium]
MRREIRLVLSTIRARRAAPLVTVYLCSNRTIRRLNRQWFGKDRATNVISFRAPAVHQAVRKHGPVPVRKAGLSRYASGGSGQVFLGDMAISVERTLTEAGRAGVSASRWAGHLARHGLMHLLGYSHKTMP